MDLIGRDFLTLLDFTPAEIGSLLDLAAELKAKKKAGIPHDTLRGKNHLPGPHRQPDRQKGVHCGHRAGAVRHV